ncbi:TPA: tyrosine-type recombinase/integrase [Streptococcus suis]
MNITQKTKKNGQTVYQTSLYLGVDSVTGKKVRTTITARTKKEVQLKARQKQAEFEQKGGTVYQEVKIKTYEELLDLWYEVYQLDKKPNTLRQFIYIKKCFLLPNFGKLKIKDITPLMIQTVVNKWAKDAYNKSPNVVKSKGVYSNFKLLHAYNKRILNHAVSLGLINENPASKVEIPKLPKSISARKKFFTDSEIKSLFDYLERNQNTYQDLYDMTLYSLLLATGCRINEALALEWSDIDFTRRKISITKTVNNHLQINSPKTRTSTRTIDIDAQTIKMLKNYQKNQRLEAWKLGKTVKLVFSKFTDKYPSKNYQLERLHATLKKVGIEPTGFHAFRHTHVSMLLNAGLPYKQLQLRLGHSTLATTMDIYAHISEESLIETANVFEKALSSVKSG